MEVAIHFLILYFPPHTEVSRVWIDLGWVQAELLLCTEIGFIQFWPLSAHSSSYPLQAVKNEGTWGMCGEKCTTAAIRERDW